MNNISHVKSRRGFTLIEMLVTLAILGVVATITVSLQASALNLFSRGGQQADEQNSTRLASDFITSQARYAKSLQLLTTVPAPQAGYYDIFLSGGRIIFHNNGEVQNPVALASTGNFTLDFKKSSSKLLEFTVGKSTGHRYDINTVVAVFNVTTTIPYVIEQQGAGPYIGIRYSLNVLNDQQILDIAMASLIIPNPDFIINDLTLPIISFKNSTISWTSSLPGIIESDGTIHRPDTQSIYVVLTATLASNDSTATKSFTLRVISLSNSYIDSVADVYETAIRGAVYSMPSKVLATLNDGSQTMADVTWGSSINTASAGEFSSVGTVAGYGGTVTLHLTVNEGVGALIPFADLAIGDYVRIKISDTKSYDFQKIGTNKLLIRWVNTSTYDWTQALTQASAFKNEFDNGIVVSSSLLTSTEVSALSVYKDTILATSIKWWLETQVINNTNKAYYVDVSGEIKNESKTKKQQFRPAIVLASGQKVSGGDGTQGTPYILYQGN